MLALSWRATGLIVLFAGLRRITRRWFPARLLFAGWLLIALRMLLPFSLPMMWSPYRFAPALDDAITRNLVPAPAPAVPAPSPAVATQTDSTPAPLFSWPRSRIVGLLWLAGVGAMVGARAVAGRRLRRTIRRGQIADDPRLLKLLRREVQELRIRTRIRLVTSTTLRAPAIMGTWRPRLLMPAAFPDQLSDEDLRLILRHELGHWRRRDLWMNAFLHAVLAVHWFNPAAWLAVHLARRDCEFACDEFVLRSSAAASAGAYGAALLKALGTLNRVHPSPAALGVFENKHQLRRRLEMIMSYKSSNLCRTLAGAAILGVVLLGSFTPTGAADNATASAITTDAPAPWFENGSSKESYVVGVDSTQKHIQPNSAYVKSTASVEEGFGGMMQTFGANDFRGKRVRFSAWVKTAEVPKGANLWVRVDAGANHAIQFDNMSDRPIKGTSDWTHCAVVLDVPAESTDINVGFFISGTGQAWVNDAKFEIVGPEVATTGKATREAPGNLAFNPTVTK